MGTLSWKDMAETMQAYAAVMEEAALAFEEKRFSDGRQACDRARAERARLKTLRQFAQESMPETNEELRLFALTQESVERAQLAEQKADVLLSQRAPVDDPLSEEGMNRTIDSGIPQVWDFGHDLVVVLGVASSGFVPLLKQRGFKRIMWIMMAGDVLPDNVSGVVVARDVEDALILCVAYDLRPPSDMVLFSAMGAVSPETQADVSRALQERLQSAAMTQQTLAERGDEFVLNITSNIPSLAVCGTVPRLADALRGKPAVIVCPGPSLEKSIEALKEFQDKALVIVVNHALSAVQKHGIRPDVVVAADSKPGIAAHLNAGNLEDVGVFALGVSVHPSVFEAVVGKPVFSFMGNPAAEFWLDDLVSPPEKFPLGGTVAHGAAMLALGWRCDPVVFVGQDLAYSNGNAYARDTDFAATFELSTDNDEMGTLGEERQRLYRVKSWGEKTLATSVQFLMYKAWYEEMVKAEPTTRFVNCSEDGAYIEGMEHLPLTVLADTIAAEPIGIDQTLRERVLAGKKSDLGDVKQRVGDRIARLEDIASLAQKCCAVLSDKQRSSGQEANLKALEKELGQKQGACPELTILMQEAIQKIAGVAGHVRSKEHAEEISLALYTAIEESAIRLLSSYACSRKQLDQI